MTKLSLLLETAIPPDDAVAVTLTADTGAVITKTAAWKYTFNIMITVKPNAGQIGTKVSITGFRMLGGGKKVDKVTLKGKAVSKIVSSTDILVVVIADGQDAGKGDIVMTADIGSVTTLKDGFTYNTASKITKVDPATGQLGYCHNPHRYGHAWQRCSWG